MLTPYQKFRIRKIIPFGVLWFYFAILYVLVEKGLMGDLEKYPTTGNPYDFRYSLAYVSVLALISGLIMGTVEVLYLGKMFNRFSFAVKIFLKTLVYLAFICGFLAFLSVFVNSARLGRPIDDPLMVSMTVRFITNYTFWSIVLYIGSMVALSLLFSEVREHLGVNVFEKYLSGKYHRPREEERIFMFLDIRSSTALAEKMGHDRYFSFLNTYYADITSCIIQTGGDIYQYVGDEVVITWELEDGVRDHNCLACFFLIKKKLASAADRYLQRFGAVPEFKAGLHCGRVSTGTIGVLKKEIIFTGDVLNTAARIQKSCNPLEVDLLMSEVLFQKLDKAFPLQARALGDIALSGKNQPVRLFTCDALLPAPVHGIFSIEQLN